MQTEKSRTRKKLHREESKAGSIATGRKGWEKVFTIIWVVVTLGFFAESMFDEGKLAEISLEIGILLISLKLAWAMMQEAKVNHYMFWVLQTLDFKANDIRADLRRQHRMIEKLRQEVCLLREQNENACQARLSDDEASEETTEKIME